MKKTKNKRLFIIVIIIICIFSFIVFFAVKREENNNGFELDPIYDVMPKDVRNLYSNIVSIPCLGDLKLEFPKKQDKIEVSQISDVDLLNYLFSYLEKNGKLSDQINLDIIRNASEDLFATDIDLISEINNFQYGDYLYNLTKNVIKRTENKCISGDIQYVSQLYGFSYNKDLLSMDIKIGYSKDGYLYNLANKKLGKYSGDIQELGTLFVGSSYYRYNYVLDGKTYKLHSVEWLNRG